MALRIRYSLENGRREDVDFLLSSRSPRVSQSISQADELRSLFHTYLATLPPSSQSICGSVCLGNCRNVRRNKDASTLVRPTARYLAYTATPLYALLRELKRRRVNALLCQEYEYARFDTAVLDEAQRVKARYHLAEERIARVPNALDLHLWRPIERASARRELGLSIKQRIVICHGRVDVHRKGRDVLLAAWADVRAEAQLILIGSAEDAGVKFAFHAADVLTISIEPTELLLIDTLHTEEQLRAELQLHASRVARFIALHDTTTFGDHGEVPGKNGLLPAIIDFLHHRPEWTIFEHRSNCNGLTILGRRSQIATITVS